jgi:hypothetical protein
VWNHPGSGLLYGGAGLPLSLFSRIHDGQPWEVEQGLDLERVRVRVRVRSGLGRSSKDSILKA